MAIYQEVTPFHPTYLYIKQHSITGLLYFGKTHNHPENYLGSGLHWTRHIKKHGKAHIETLWYCLFHDVESISSFALMCSEQWDIVKSDRWLNMKPENGLDGNIKGNYHTNESIQLMCKTMKSKNIYTLTDSNGNVFKTHDLKKFCKCYMLSLNTLQRNKGCHVRALTSDHVGPGKNDRLLTYIRLNTTGWKMEIFKNKFNEYVPDEYLNHAILYTNEELENMITNLRINQPIITKPHSSNTIEKMRIIARNREPISDETKNKLKEKIECPHCQILMHKSNAKRYHGDNCKFKPNESSILPE